MLTVLLHDLEELYGDLGARAYKHLALTTLLSIVDGLKGISENAHANHSEQATRLGVNKGCQGHRCFAEIATIEPPHDDLDIEQSTSLSNEMPGVRLDHKRLNVHAIDPLDTYGASVCLSETI